MADSLITYLLGCVLCEWCPYRRDVQLPGQQLQGHPWERNIEGAWRD